MTLEELINARAIAGATYAAAIEQLHTAYVNLAAIDQALMNGGIGHDGAPDVRTFAELPQCQEKFAHPVFAPIAPAQCWRGEVTSRRDEILKGFEQ
ncbi:hypothetical protein [Methylocystis sp.]|uniref:hypothetical protein n=1 Tax=Methylocystis sp. TaxID=1911079 RepID=UPI003DA26369